MNILLFSQRFWPENFRINNIAESLRKKNNIFVVTEKPNYPDGNIKKKYKKSFFFNEIWKNIKIYRSPTISRGKNSKLNLLLNYINFIIISPIVLSKNLKKKKIDIIFVYATSPIFQALPAIIYGKLNSIPVVLWVQDIWPDVLKDLGIIKNRLALIIINYFVKIIYNNSDYIFVQSLSFKKKISKYSDKKIKILYNPETKKIINKNFNKINKNFIITYAGNIGKAQSFDTLIEALKKINKPKFKIYIYGDGSEKNKLLKDINKFNLEKTVKVFKPISKSEIDIVLSKSNAFLLILGSGDGLSSTLPAKLQTYIAHNKPIVVSANGESYNFVKKNKLGFVSKAGNSTGLSQSILDVQKLKKKNLNLIKKRSLMLFKNNFEINEWTRILEQKLENCAEDYKRCKVY